MNCRKMFTCGWFMPLAAWSLLGMGRPPRTPEFEEVEILFGSLQLVDELLLGSNQGWLRIASRLRRSPTSTRMHWRRRSWGGGSVENKIHDGVDGVGDHDGLGLLDHGDYDVLIQPTLQGSEMRCLNLSSAPQICSSDSNGMSPHT